MKPVFTNTSCFFVTFVVRLLLAKETKEREEVEKKKHELEEQLNRYSTQFETTQQGTDVLNQRKISFKKFNFTLHIVHE